MSVAICWLPVSTVSDLQHGQAEGWRQSCRENQTHQIFCIIKSDFPNEDPRSWLSNENHSSKPFRRNCWCFFQTFLLCSLCRWCEPRSSGSDEFARRKLSLASRPWVELTHQFSGHQSYWWKNNKDHEHAIVVSASTVLHDLLSWAHLWRTFLGLSQKRHTFQ